MPARSDVPGGTADPREPAQDVLVVAVCNGHRCARLRTSAAGSEASADDLLRGAVRDRPEAVLVSVPCLGPCHRGAVVAVGRGIARPGHLRWVAPPVGLDLIDRTARARELAAWITDSAADVQALTDELRRLGA